MFDELMIHGDGAQLAPDGLRIPIRLPWYRSLPLSSIEGVDLEIDGDHIAEDRIGLALNGSTRTLSDVAGAAHALWFVLDPAVLVVDHDLEPGEHRIDLKLTVRIPYGDPDFRPIRFVQVSTCSKHVMVTRVGAR